jgi:hypothetical protein
VVARQHTLIHPLGASYTKQTYSQTAQTVAGSVVTRQHTLILPLGATTETAGLCVGLLLRPPMAGVQLPKHEQRPQQQRRVNHDSECSALAWCSLISSYSLSTRRSCSPCLSSTVLVSLATSRHCSAVCTLQLTLLWRMTLACTHH